MVKHTQTIPTNCLSVFDNSWRLTLKGLTFIVKFSHRKNCKEIVGVKKDFLIIKINDVVLSGRDIFFIDKNLCLYEKVIWSKSNRSSHQEVFC